MSRPLRIGFAGALHHAMARGDRREEIFRDDRDRSKFIGYLAEGAERYSTTARTCYETEHAISSALLSVAVAAVQSANRGSAVAIGPTFLIFV